MLRLPGVTRCRSLRGFLAAARRHEPTRHRRARQARHLTEPTDTEDE